jgi:hypothetical protein
MHRRGHGNLGETDPGRCASVESGTEHHVGEVSATDLNDRSREGLERSARQANWHHVRRKGLRWCSLKRLVRRRPELRLGRDEIGADLEFWLLRWRRGSDEAPGTRGRGGVFGVPGT